MELIDRNALLEKAYYRGKPATVGHPYPDGTEVVDVEDIEDAPTIDAVPIVHAKWELARYATEWTCSNCDGEMLYQITTYGGGQYHDIDNIFPPYCPHCGAKMDL